MSDAPAKKRPWFQLHLSTCVVLMVVAGSLIAVNVFGYAAVWTRGPYTVEARVFGWPWEVWLTVLNAEQGSAAYDPVKLAKAQEVVEKDLLESWPIVSNSIKNFAFLCGLLFGLGLASEFAIRRRERMRKVRELEPKKKRAWWVLLRSTWASLAAMGAVLVALNLYGYHERGFVDVDAYGFPLRCFGFSSVLSREPQVWWSLPACLLDAATAAAFLFLGVVAAQWYRLITSSRTPPTAPPLQGRPRSWAYLHLSTCVLLMGVASVLVWLNLADLWARSEVHLPYTMDQVPVVGWPNSGRFWDDELRIVSRCPGGEVIAMEHDASGVGVVLDWIAPNLAVALALLVWAAVPCELAIRLRKKQAVALFAESQTPKQGAVP